MILRPDDLAFFLSIASEARRSHAGRGHLGESVTLEASNPGPAVRLNIATLTVGGDEGVSGNVAGPDTITVGRTFTIPARTAELTALATFPVSDPGLENVPGPGVLEAVNNDSLASGC